MHAWSSVYEKNLKLAFSSTVRFVAKRYDTAEVSERTNRNLPARNMLVQLLALNTDREKHDGHRYGYIDRTTIGSASSRSYCVYSSTIG